MCNNWNSSRLLLGISNGTVILEGYVTDSYETKDDREILFLNRYAKQMKIYAHKKTYTCHGWSMPVSKGSSLSLNTTKSIFSKDNCTMYHSSLWWYDDNTSPLKGEVFVLSPGIKWTFVSVSTNGIE